MRQIKAMKRKIANPGGWGVIHEPSGTEIPRVLGGTNRKNHPWEGYGYFLESHISSHEHCLLEEKGVM